MIAYLMIWIHVKACRQKPNRTDNISKNRWKCHQIHVKRMILRCRSNACKPMNLKINCRFHMLCGCMITYYRSIIYLVLFRSKISSCSCRPVVRNGFRRAYYQGFTVYYTWWKEAWIISIVDHIISIIIIQSKALEDQIDKNQRWLSENSYL